MSLSLEAPAGGSRPSSVADGHPAVGGGALARPLAGVYRALAALVEDANQHELELFQEASRLSVENQRLRHALGSGLFRGTTVDPSAGGAAVAPGGAAAPPQSAVSYTEILPSLPGAISDGRGAASAPTDLALPDVRTSRWSDDFVARFSTCQSEAPGARMLGRRSPSPGLAAPSPQHLGAGIVAHTMTGGRVLVNPAVGVRSSAGSARAQNIRAKVKALQQSAMGVFRSTDGDDDGDPTEHQESGKPRLRVRATAFGDKAAGLGQGRRMFSDPNSVKEKVRRNLMKSEYNIANLYKTTGLAQRIARSFYFEMATLSIIVINALWIGVDADINESALLVDAPPVFQAAENLFCLYFLFEWTVKFAAFEHKLPGFRDHWFCLDTFLAWMSVVETWVLSIVIAILRGISGGRDTSASTASFLQNVSLLRVLRLMRLLRMARLARVFRSLPEVMVLIRAMATAVRTVLIALCFLLVCVYIFAVALTQMSRGTVLEKEHFSSVLGSMHTLLIAGVFPDTETLLKDTLAEHFMFWLAVFVFMLFSAIAVMNMMIGVLVEVVKQAQSIEKELWRPACATPSCASTLSEHLSGPGQVLEAVLERPLLDNQNAASIGVSREDFWTMLDNPQVAKVLHQTGVDVVGLIDLVDFIYLERPWLPFHQIIEVILQLRSSNTATVRDLVDFRKYMTHEFHVLRTELVRDLPERLAEPVLTGRT